MSKFLPILAVLLICAAFVAAQQDPNISYDDENNPVAYLFSFRIPFGTPGTPVDLAAKCGDLFTKAFTARDQAFVEYAVPVSVGTRPTYLATARTIFAEPTAEATEEDTLRKTCREAINPDVSKWVENFVLKCKFRSACGGSAVCACGPDQTCKYTYDERDNLTAIDFCEPAYLCTNTDKSEPPVDEQGNPIPVKVTDAKCTYSRKPFVLNNYNQTYTETAFYDIARGSTCSVFNLEMTFALQQSQNLYFSATSDDDVTKACSDLFVARFGGEFNVNNNQNCQTTCGAVECVCEKDNKCLLGWDEKAQGHKQCTKDLKCEMVNGVAICNNAVIYSAFFAIICTTVALFF